MVLVTGSNSQLGRKVVQRLLAAGEKIRCVDAEKPRDLPDGVEFMTADLSDEGVLRKACAGASAVFHFMDEHTPRHGRRRMRHTNVRGTANLLAAMKTAGVRRLIHLSSYEVYGRAKNLPTRPEDRTRPITRYGKHKLKAEKLLWPLMKKGEFDITVLRPALIVGPGTENPIILITLLMAMGMDEANRMYITGHGDTRFQMLHPDDAADGIIRAWKSPASTGKIYNLGSDNVPTHIEQTVKVKDQARLDCIIRHLSPFTTRVLSILLRPFRINYLNREHVVYLTTDLILDCQHAKEELGWNPTRDNIAIMIETITWYRDEKL